MTLLGVIIRIQKFKCFNPNQLHFIVPPRYNNDDVEESNDEKTVKIGDMILSDQQYQYLYSNDSMKRHGLQRAFNHWPKGVVPVKISDEFSVEYKNVIIAAMKAIMKVSCIKFEWEKPPPANFVHIMKGTGCTSFVGFARKGEQITRLSEQCKQGNVIHEFLHTLGFLHMHTAAQRDKYVKIKFDNIHKDFVKNFEKITAHVSMYNTQYDYRSIMHYSKEAFAIDKSKPTIIPFEHVPTLGQREGKCLNYD